MEKIHTTFIFSQMSCFADSVKSACPDINRLPQSGKTRFYSKSEKGQGVSKSLSQKSGNFASRMQQIIF